MFAFSSPGDKNYYAQFWYARELCLVDQYQDAQPLFTTLSEAKLPYYDKTEIRGRVLDQTGNPRRFDGTILVVRPTYAFIQSETPKMRVFYPFNDENSVSSALRRAP